MQSMAWKDLLSKATQYHQPAITHNHADHALLEAGLCMLPAMRDGRSPEQVQAAVATQLDYLARLVQCQAHEIARRERVPRQRAMVLNQQYGQEPSPEEWLAAISHVLLKYPGTAICVRRPADDDDDDAAAKKGCWRGRLAEAPSSSTVHLERDRCTLQILDKDLHSTGSR